MEGFFKEMTETNKGKGKFSIE